MHPCALLSLTQPKHAGMRLTHTGCAPAPAAGPLFDASAHMDFYNLELKDTNVVDHNTHDYSKEGLVFEIVGGSS